MICLIAAIDRQRGIGKNGGQPWKIPTDEAHFARLTKTHGGNMLVGLTTFRTFHGPLPDRHNYVLTHRAEPIKGVTLVDDLNKFLEQFNDQDLWVIGGAAVYDEVLKTGLASELYLTHIDADLHCNQFFPEYENQFKLVERSEPQTQNGFSFFYATYAKLPA